MIIWNLVTKVSNKSESYKMKQQDLISALMEQAPCIVLVLK